MSVMDKHEKIAYEYLKSKGFKDIEYEPDGNVPPDFLVDKKYAIEVRRLNENIIINEGYEGLEEKEIPLYQKVQKVISSFDKSTNGSCSVWYKFSRPIPKLKTVENELKELFINFLKDDRHRLDTRLNCGIEVTITKSVINLEKKFYLAGLSDKDSGGYIVELVDKNLRLCIEEKTRKIENVKDKYSQWWLILIDYISFGLDEFDQKELKEHFKFEHNWDRILIIDPSNYNNSFEMSD